MRNVVWAVALPCIFVAVVGVLQYQPFHQGEITANLVPRDTNNIPIPNTPITQDNGQSNQACVLLSPLTSLQSVSIGLNRISRRLQLSPSLPFLNFTFGPLSMALSPISHP